MAVVLPCAVGLAAEYGDSAEGESGEHHNSSTLWKTANFIILAAALGYGISKVGGAFFRSRSEEIRNGIAEATKLRQEAEARVAEMDRRMENLGTEIESLREGAKQEMVAEQQRMRAETEQLLTRMQANAEREIASAAKHARKQLRAYSAELALDLARRKIRDRMTPAAAGALVDSFVEELARAPWRVK
jgi:F-type H+-transporting ATPase subunit b